MRESQASNLSCEQTAAGAVCSSWSRRPASSSLSSAQHLKEITEPIFAFTLAGAVKVQRMVLMVLDHALAPSEALMAPMQVHRGESGMEDASRGPASLHEMLSVLPSRPSRSHRQSHCDKVCRLPGHCAASLNRGCAVQAARQQRQVQEGQEEGLSSCAGSKRQAGAGRGRTPV